MIRERDPHSILAAAATSHPQRIERPSGTFLIRGRRTGALQSRGFLIGYLLAFVSWLRCMSNGPRTWTVELWTAPSIVHTLARASSVRKTEYPSRAEMEAALVDLVAELHSGSLDGLLGTTPDGS